MTTRIMVIDDEPLICTLLEYQLGGAGYAVSAFQCGEEALLRLAHEQPDLILLDVMMPEISGWDLCRQIRASSSVPVIMLTAKQGDDDVVAGLSNGADDYVGKPFNQAQLIARIEAVLRRAQGRAARPALAARVEPPVAPLLGGATAAPVTGAPALRAPASPTPPAPAAATGAPTTPASPTAPALHPSSFSLPPSPPPLPRLGPRLADARRQHGLSLHAAGQAAGVRWEFLQAIEQEEFSYVPRAELRHALKAYSAMLGVDLTPYMGRGGRKRKRRPQAFTLTVGMAAVLAIALILIAMTF